MAKKGGLGRGLSNLLPGAGDAAPRIESNPEYQQLAIQTIDPNPEQPRKVFREAEINELVQSLQSVGMIEPVIVRKNGDRYSLIAGERRWRAAQKAGFKKIPAIIKQLSEPQAVEMALIENIQREDLTAIEEARAYEALMNLTGDKATDLARRLGKDRATVTNLVRLLKLPGEVLEMIEQRKITAGQARPLLSLGDRRMIVQLADKIASDGMTARKVEEEVSRLTEGSNSKTKSSGERKDPSTRHLEERIRARFTARVDISHKATGAGKISIQYASLDDLDRILELMGVHEK